MGGAEKDPSSFEPLGPSKHKGVLLAAPGQASTRSKRVSESAEAHFNRGEPRSSSPLQSPQSPSQPRVTSTSSAGAAKTVLPHSVSGLRRDSAKEEAGEVIRKSSTGPFLRHRQARDSMGYVRTETAFDGGWARRV